MDEIFSGDISGRYHRTCSHVSSGQHKSESPVRLLCICQLSSTSTHLLHPQTRMQVFATSPAAVYTGVGNAFTRISSTEGMRALWRGVSSVIMGAGPAHAVHFGAYEMVKEMAGGNVEGVQNQWIATCASPVDSPSLTSSQLLIF